MTSARIEEGQVKAGPGLSPPAEALRFDGPDRLARASSLQRIWGVAKAAFYFRLKKKKLQVNFVNFKQSQKEFHKKGQQDAEKFGKARRAQEAEGQDRGAGRGEAAACGPTFLPWAPSLKTQILTNRTYPP